jgi:hypothetical protein
MVREFQHQCDWETYIWDNREALIERAKREEVAREASGS